MLDRTTTDAILGALPFGALLLDARGTILAANPELERTTGRNPEAVRGQSFFTAFADLPGLREAETGILDALRESMPTPSLVTRLEDRDSGMKLHLRPLHPEGEAFILALFEPIRGDEALQRALLDLERKLDSVARIKHEISNPLMGLIGTAELLEARRDLPPESRRYVGTILNEGRRILDCLQELNKLRKR